jgi:signal transduction histidine kinase
VEIRGGKLRVSVTDSGPGIPKGVVAKIFQPFFTTKEIGRGTGLGLAVSRGLVEEQGGRLFLDENSSQTRFVVELSLLPGDDSQGEAA